MKITIGGIEVPYQPGSVSIDDALGQRSTASFVVIDKQGNKRYGRGQQVVIWNDTMTEKMFSGVIHRCVASYMSLGNIAKTHDISCSDWTYLTDKRIMAKAYRNQSAGSIVRDIITNYLTDEGITEGEVQDGPAVVEAVFNYTVITDNLDSLAEKAGFEWWIDFDKKLHFVARDTFQSDIEIKDDSPIRRIKVEDAAEKYRNRQYIRAGKDITDPQTERFVADGTQKTFTVGYPVAKEPIIKVDGIEQTVGVKGLHTGQQWYFSRGSNSITQDNQEEPLTEGSIVEITYQGLFDIVAVTYDTQEVEDRQEIEGGSGYHDAVDDNPNITSRDSAFDEANAKLRRYGTIGTRVTFDTLMSNFKAGQLVRITLTDFGVDDEFLVESVSGTDTRTLDNRFIYTISAVAGAVTGGWAKFFKNMATRGQAFVIRENIKEDEILIQLDMFSKTWTLADIPNIFKEVYPSNTLFPSNKTFPMFEPSRRITNLELYGDDGRIIRKKLTKQVWDEDTKQLRSIFFVNSFDGYDIQFTQMKLYGGIEAKDEVIGSGVVVDTVPYTRMKTRVEGIQIDRLDIKGW